MKGLLGIIIILLILRFGGSIIDGMFSAVGVVGKLVGFVLGVIFIYLLLIGGCR